jgi:hypothetical protein
MANRPDMIISNKKQKGCVMIELSIQAGTNVTKRKYKRHYNTRDYLEPEMYDYIRNNWSHRKGDKRVKEEFWEPYQENIQ